MLPSHPLLAHAEPLAPVQRHGNERRTPVRLADGRHAVLAELTAELAAQDSVRRRYRRDIARLAEFELEGIAPLLAWGPPESEQAQRPPWRLRLEPPGSSLQDWIDTRAPAPPDEVAAKLARLCERLAPLHARGLVVRDLSPAKIIESAEGALQLVDIGLARTDILSTRTAASLVLEGSPYAAPELLERTAVDGRADLYTLGMIAFVALTGRLPFAGTHALLRPTGSAPAPSTLLADIPPRLDQLIVALLEHDPSARPETAQLVADILRGRAELPSRGLVRVSCQSCAAPLPLGQRLCLSCGKLAVRFRHASPELPIADRYKLVLRKAKESSEFMAELRRLCAELVEGELPTMNFVIGDSRMYSEAERKRGIKLPLTLFNDLDLATAQDLQARFEARGVKLVLQRIEAPNSASDTPDLTRRQRRALGISGGAVVGVSGLLAALQVLPAIGAAMVLGLGVSILIAIYTALRKTNRQRFKRWGHSLLQLRSSPAALPASDPLVARLAALLDKTLAADVHALVSRLALLVQRVVDHRGRHAGAAGEIDLAVSELEPLIKLIEGRVAALRTIDAELAELDEGRLVRALAAAEARGDADLQREGALQGLDRLRELEVARASTLAALARATELVERSAQLALRVRDEQVEHESSIALALTELTTDETNGI